MLWLFIAFVVFIVIFVITGFRKDVFPKQWKLNSKQYLSLLALLLIIPSFISKIPANSVGIEYSPFSGTSEKTLKEGFHAKNPFSTIYVISTEVQTMQVEDLTTQTKDAQFVTSALDIKYTVDSENAYLVFKQFRTLENMSNTLIVPTVQRTLELITTEYNVIDILGSSRGEIYALLQESLEKELQKYGVSFYAISISDMDCGEEIEQAIVREAVAKKDAETAEQELIKVETEAKQKSVQALAEQEAAKIEAETILIEAEAQAKANKTIAESLTDNVLTGEYIEKWDGKMPYVVGSDNVMFDIASLVNGEQGQ